MAHTKRRSEKDSETPRPVTVYKRLPRKVWLREFAQL